MAYYPTTRSQDPQDLENWFALAMQQRSEREPQRVDMAALPQNYAMSSGGSLMDFGPTQSAWAGAPQGTQLDYANPVEIAGVGKGWLAKNDPSMTVYNNQGQRIASLGNDLEATRKLQAAQVASEHAQLQNRKLAQELQPKAMAPQLVDGQWVYPPSAERPGGAAYPVEGFQRRTATDAKVELEREQKTLAKERVSSLVDELTSNYQSLAKKNALVSPSQPVWQNVRARLAASGAGQLVSGAVGTEEQSIRDEIATKIPALFNEIRAVTGLSAKALDSNAELQFFKQTATDPTKSLEANLEALRSIENRYGLGRSGLSEAPAQAPSTPVPAPAGGRQIRDQGAYIEADGKRYVVIRRNPDGSAVIRDPQTGRTGTMRQ